MAQQSTRKIRERMKGEPVKLGSNIIDIGIVVGILVLGLGTVYHLLSSP